MAVDYQERREPTIFNSLLMLFFVAILLFVALLFRQNDLSLLAILIFCLVGGTKAWSSFSSARIRCVGSIDTRRSFPGETFTLATSVENGKWLPISVRIMWSFEGGLKPIGNNESIVRHQGAVLWHQTVKFRQEFLAVQRGVYQVGPPQILTSDLLGFFEKVKLSFEATHIIVYPRLAHLKPVTIRRRELFEVPGAKSPVQDPVYILGTRDYQASRPSRHIHWKASARHLRLQEKIFEPSEQEKVLLTLDVGSFQNSEQEDSFERTLEIVASLAVRLDRQGYAAGLVANGSLTGGNGSIIPVARGPRQVATILETLARMRKKQDGAIKEVIAHALESQRGVSCVHIFHAGGLSASGVEMFFRRRKVPVTFLVCGHQPTSQSPRRKNGCLWYSIDDLRMDRNRPS
jgi:uncharacterized protein (DUF58 family)